MVGVDDGFGGRFRIGRVLVDSDGLGHYKHDRGFPAVGQLDGKGR